MKLFVFQVMSWEIVLGFSFVIELDVTTESSAMFRLAGADQLGANVKTPV